MRKMKKSMRRKMKMSTRLMVLYTGLTILLLAAVASFYYGYNETSIYEESVANLSQIADSTMLQIDSSLTVMEQTTVDVLADREFMLAWEANLREQTDTNMAVIRSVMTNAYKNKSNIRRVAAFDAKGNYYCTGVVDFSREDLLKKIEYIQSNYQFNIQNTRVFKGPEKDFWDKDAEGTVISEIKPIKDSNANILGYIEVQQNVFYLDRICNLQMNGYPLKVIVFMEDNDVFYKNFSDEPEGYPETIAEMTSEYSKIRETKDSIICTVSSNYYQGRAVFILEKSSLRQLIWNVIKGMVALVLVLFALTFLFVVIVTRRIFNPINSLLQHMSRQDLTNFNGKLEITPKDYETEILASTYETMMQRLRDAIDRQEKLKMVQTKTLFSILQSEISPHFLYNTLGSIANMCQEGQGEAAAEACYDLSDILRYSSDYKSAEVSIQEEIRNLHAYLSLMKTRYRQRLEYEITADEDTFFFLIPKLTLQPLVENGIKYSLMEKETVVIQVFVVMVGPELILEVKDNGCGISEEALEIIRQRLDEIQDAEAFEKISNQIQIGGMGLSGTLIRLSIFFGEDFSWQVTRTNDEDGTTIMIKINTEHNR